MTTRTDALQDMRNDVRKRAEQTVGEAKKTVKKSRQGLVEAKYVAVGTGAVLADAGRRFLDEARSFPETAKRVRTRAPEVVSEQIEALAERGREVLSDGARRPGVAYEDRTVDELRDLAAERDIDGRSTMTKDQLIAALRNGS